MNGTEMRDWRKRNGYTQAQAADAIGCSVRALHQWENEIHAIPKYIALAVSAVNKKLQPYGS